MSMLVTKVPLKEFTISAKVNMSVEDLGLTEKELKELRIYFQKEESKMPDLILLKDVDYFGRLIKRGSTFKCQSGTKDWYELWESKDGIIMQCPAITLHYTSIKDSYFVEQYESTTKPQECV